MNALTVGFVALALAAVPAAEMVNFDKAEPGKPPAGWRTNERLGGAIDLVWVVLFTVPSTVVGIGLIGLWNRSSVVGAIYGTSAMIVGSPRLLLLDEPFSSLDRELRVALRGERGTVQRQLRVTTIYVTHDLEDAAALAERTVTMRRGTIEGVTSRVVKSGLRLFDWRLRWHR